MFFFYFTFPLYYMFLLFFSTCFRTYVACVKFPFLPGCQLGDVRACLIILLLYLLPSNICLFINILAFLPSIFFLVLTSFFLVSFPFHFLYSLSIYLHFCHIHVFISSPLSSISKRLQPFTTFTFRPSIYTSI